MFLRKSLIEMTKGRLREFRREPSAFFFVLFMPLLWMFILGLAFSEAVALQDGQQIIDCGCLRDI